MFDLNYTEGQVDSFIYLVVSKSDFKKLLCKFCDFNFFIIEFSILKN